VHRLTPVDVIAFNPYGTGHQGDHTNLASLAIDGSPATAWQSDWYTTPHFGGLYPGTGLLVDMGRAKAVSVVRMTLGPAPGAAFQVRVGTAPALAALPAVASVAHAGTDVRVKLKTPAHGRYVLIWFTRLPADPAGQFQASVYDLRLLGESGRHS
jgi:hypothetical protein